MLIVALASLALIGLLCVIGGSAAWALGLRGVWWIGAVAPFAFSIVAISSTVAPWMHVPWSFLPVAVVAAVITVLIRVIRWRVLRWAHVPTPSAGRAAVWAALAVALAAAVTAWRVVAVFGGDAAISQTFDNVFHLNAVRYILDTGSASSLEVGGLTSPTAFYPAVWHATVALVVQITGASIPAAVQAVTIVVSAVVWPTGAVALTAALFGTRRWVLLAAGVVSTAVPAFPVLLLDYGVLYPYQLSLALLPFTLAATVNAVREPRARERDRGRWALALVGALPGLALSHPGGVVGWLALSLPIFVALLVRLWREHPARRARAAVGAAAVGYAGVGLLLLKVLRPAAEARAWATPLSPLEAVWQIVSVSMYAGGSAVLVALATVFGIVCALRARSWRHRTALGIWAVGALLFFVVSGVPRGPIRDAITGSWYNNWPRLAALFVVALVPIAALGLGTAARLLSEVWSRRTGPRTGLALSALIAIVVLVVAQYPAMARMQASAHKSYRMDDRALLLSPDEAELLARVADEVPEDGVIAGNPYTGTALAYAYSDRRVLMPHMLAYLTEEGQSVNHGLRDAVQEPDVCDAILNLGVTHVLDFGEREVHGERHAYHGLADLAHSDAVELVDQQGSARLYRIVACGLADDRG